MSIDGWKTKAKSRRDDLRNEKLKSRDLRKSRNEWKEKYFLLKKQLDEMTLIPTDCQVASLNNQQIQFIMVSFCINLVINGPVSFSAVPKILILVNDVFAKLGCVFQFKIPHFTTVLNWSLRLGTHLLKSALIPCSKPWICIIDHTIQIGSKKAFVVLKILQEDIKAHGNLTLNNVEVLHIQVQTKSNGDIIKSILEKIFQVVGNPVQMVMDGGSDLNKGVNLIVQEMTKPFHVTYDLTHFIASLLKKKYSDFLEFNEVMSLLANSKNKIRQTILAHLMPRKERSKSRFINLPSSAQWFEKMLTLLGSIAQDSKKQTSLEQKTLEHFQWILDCSDFLKGFVLEMQVVSELQTLLKNTIFNAFSYKRALNILQQMDDSNLRIPLQDYLNAAFGKTQNSQGSLLLFSDIIESLFGKYKFLAKPNSFSEINRLVLLLPIICADITPESTEVAFKQTQNKEVIEFQKNIGPSILAKRKKAFKIDLNKKHELAQIISFPKQNLEPPLGDNFSHGLKVVGSNSHHV